jgi:hypothetical protein
MQDPKFLNLFSKNTFKIVILILISFVFFYMMNFLSHKDEHNLFFFICWIVICCFNKFKTFPYQNRFSSSFFLKSNTQLRLIKNQCFFFVLAKTLERNKLRKTRKQILDMTTSKENPRITYNNEN